MSLKTLMAAAGKHQVLIPLLQDWAGKAYDDMANETLSRKEFTISLSKQTIEAMKRKIEEFNHGEISEEQLFHPSALGQCLRKMWFKQKCAPESVSTKGEALKMHLVFEVGTMFHIIVQSACEQAGVLEESEVAIVDHKNKLLGHCDGVLKIDGVRYVLEIKTINSRGFTLLKEPKHEHVQQAQAYMHSLGIKWCVFLYYNKDSSELKEYIVSYDAVFYDRHVAKRINKFFGLVETNTLPDREGTSPDMFPCAYCGFAEFCFDDRRVKSWMPTTNKLNEAKAKGKKASGSTPKLKFGRR